MARTDTLGNFLTDVAEAIRTKEGTTETIPASEFDTRISNLSGGGSEDLSEELGTYNEELTEQKATIKTIVQTLQNKASAGAGGCLGQPLPLLSMNVSTVQNGLSKTDTTDTMALYNWSSNSTTRDTNPNIALVFWFVRSNYTISDNVTVIYESEPFTSPDGLTQYLCVGYMNYVNGETITLTQETSDRIGLGYLPLCNCGIPTVVNSTYISNDSESDILINTDEHLNIYIVNSVYTISLSHNLNTMSNGEIVSNFGWYSRLGCIISTNPIQDAKIRHQGKFYGNIVQVRCPAKVYE